MSIRVSDWKSVHRTTLPAVAMTCTLQPRLAAEEPRQSPTATRFGSKRKDLFFADEGTGAVLTKFAASSSEHSALQARACMSMKTKATYMLRSCQIKSKAIMIRGNDNPDVRLAQLFECP
jgi:hypothetical protein